MSATQIAPTPAPDTAAPAYELTYDALVIALGSIARTLPIPGLAEFGIGFKQVEEAIALRNQVLEKLDRASSSTDPALRRRALTSSLPPPADPARGGRGGWASTPSPRCASAGSRCGWTPGWRSSVDGHIELSDGQRFDCEDLGVDGRGEGRPAAQEATDLPLGRERAGSGAMPTSRWTARDGVGGLRATVPRCRRCDRSWGVHRASAQHAVRQARRLGDNVVLSLRGEPLIDYKHKYAGSVAYLGMHEGVAHVYGGAAEGLAGLVHAPHLSHEPRAHPHPQGPGGRRLDLRLAVPAGRRRAGQAWPDRDRSSTRPRHRSTPTIPAGLYPGPGGRPRHGAVRGHTAARGPLRCRARLGGGADSHRYAEPVPRYYAGWARVVEGIHRVLKPLRRVSGMRVRSPSRARSRATGNGPARGGVLPMRHATVPFLKE